MDVSRERERGGGEEERRKKEDVVGASSCSKIAQQNDTSQCGENIE